MTNKKRTWKFWTTRSLLILFILGGLWLTNLIWFKPFNIKHFYDKVFVEFPNAGNHVIGSPLKAKAVDEVYESVFSFGDKYFQQVN